jgi:hypothetical protein
MKLNNLYLTRFSHPTTTFRKMQLQLTISYVATLALGSRPKQGVVRLRAKRETQESLHMFPGVQRVWRNEPSHSQVNSHVGNWTPNGLPTLQSAIAGVKTHCLEKKIIGKLLKRRCLKWVRIAHLDIWNTSYGQKKGRELNWQFHSRPLKVGNVPNFVAWRRRATYCWKALNEGYNFALDLIVIWGLHAKLCASKVARILVLGIPFESLGTKSHLEMAPMESYRVYYKGEGGDFPQV